jgi:chromosome segregation ATPase
MNIANLLNRRDPLKRAFVALEDGMEDVLKEEFLLPPESVAPDEHHAQAEDFADELEPVEAVQEPAPAEQQEDAPVERIGPHAQHRLAAYASFEEAQARTREDLARIGESIASLVASQHMGREFLNDCYAEIHRANELENANAAFAAENRRLSERADKLERLRARYDQLVEVLKTREARLLAENETMRETIGELRLELVEARNLIARMESQQGELQTALAARTTEAERYLREAEVLREKSISLSVELDLAQKKQSESRRRAEELSAMHASDSARLSEIMGKLVAEESESARLQKSNDALEAKLVEANENAARLAAELSDRDRRHQSENHALRAEVQSLNARLQSAASEQRETLDTVATLRSRISDLETDKQVLEKRLSVQVRDVEAERRALAEGSSPAANDDRHHQETARMQAEITELRATIKRLRRTDVAQHPASKRAKAKEGAAVERVELTAADAEIATQVAAE